MYVFPFLSCWGVGSLFIFLQKTKQKSVVVLETRRENLQVCKFHCLQGRSPQQGTLRVINGCFSFFSLHPSEGVAHTQGKTIVRDQYYR